MNNSNLIILTFVITALWDVSLRYVALNFDKVPGIIQTVMPFIGDLNGDYIDDIIFNNVNGKSGKLEVAIFNSKTGVYDVSNFKDTMVDPTCGGVNSKVTNPSLTTPHSVSMIDFDGDCLSDLFLTIQDDDNPSKKYYEIYTRQEQKEESSKTKTKGSGLQSFCLV